MTRMSPMTDTHRRKAQAGPATRAAGRAPASPLAGMRLLVVEDEYLVAEEIARELSRAGAQVLEPVATIGLALSSLSAHKPQAAILDIDLSGKAVFPLADELASRALPFVFYTGYDDILIPARFQGIRCVRKPARGFELVKALLESLVGPLAVQGQKASPVAEERIVLLLPRLRSMALLIAGDRAAADRLVENALRRAIANVHRRPANLPVDEWLAKLVQISARETGAPSLH